MFKNYIFIVFFALGSLNLFPQVGGKYIYNFLNVSYSASTSALGGGLVATNDLDPTLINYNPSLLSPEYHTALTVNCVDYYNSGIYASALYAHTFDKLGSFSFEMRTINYGKFSYTNEYEETLGSFYAGDYAATVGWGRKLDSTFSIGANLKIILSDYEDYSSFGIAADVAATYRNSKKNIALSLLVKNIGSEIKPFTAGNYQKIPFDIQLAFSQKLQHLPVRYHISLHSLYKWKMGYVGENDPLLEVDAIDGTPKYPSTFSQGANNFFRHFIFGIEIIPVKYISIFVSYNHNRNREMYIPQKRTMAGFSYGFFVNIKNIRFGYARAKYATGATPNVFSFSVNLKDLSELSKENKSKKTLKRIN